ncbi:glutamine synthetase family protein [Amycolatopsis sp.]|jgi:glutamine synthetase|uniref:glutamine synthetase family protein n=1 Tax=Amycolatopsis sp. TaxID=37632 RepID=UPI002E0A9C83|nr:glutamine synthetase family protein [Amycolatopsis sp.]
MGELDRAALGARAHELGARLTARGVELVALTWVDNSGITRTKAVPLRRLANAAAWGVGASYSFDFFLFNDDLITGEYSRGAVGDLRLYPDLERLTALSAQPGWAWAPADRYDQEGVVHPQDQRSLAKAAVERLAERGYTAKMAFEVEWIITAESAPDDITSAVCGPGYGYASLSRHSDYLRAVVSALERQRIGVEQIHPEYAAGQFELSVAASDPVAAADTYVLVRETVRAVSRQHGLRASFTPRFAGEGVGNGGHVHLSVWDGETNAYAGGDRRFGMTGVAESFSAGILGRLPALLAVGAPSVVSYLRLEPHHWAGVYGVWGLENREAPLRFVTGSVGERAKAANLEVKCFDQTANPYLVVAALLFAGLAGLDEGGTLPEPVDVDPGTLPEDERRRLGIDRLPTNLLDAVAAFEADTVLTGSFGAPLATTLTDIRKAEAALFTGATAEEIARAMRWTH